MTVVPKPVALMNINQSRFVHLLGPGSMAMCRASAPPAAPNPPAEWIPRLPGRAQRTATRARARIIHGRCICEPTMKQAIFFHVTGYF